MPTTRVIALDAWLRHLHDCRGTDLLLIAGAPPTIRIDGALVPIAGEAPLRDDTVRKLAHGLLGQTLLEDLDRQRDVDFSFNWGDIARFRGNAFHQRGSVAVALRRIPVAIPSFEELGVPVAVLNRLVRLPHGLILVTGPTGSGKSTTVAAMIDAISEARPCHIITIEDPIEYHFEHRRALVSQREIGRDATSFPSALRSALRENPDVLLVGEMRDIESIQAALTVAETGHLVLASLHTNDAAQALDRIIDVFPAERRDQIQVQLAATLRAVLYQRLLPRIGGGLVPAVEILLGTSAVRNLLRTGRTNQLRNTITTQQNEGMQTLEMSLSGLVAQHVIDYDTAVRASMYPKEIALPEAPGRTASRGARRS